ncbi:hypothetical protein L0B53_02015 [Vibrio sp. SS-MA-C1-2]|uniref:hypothetical protein n=1 Tax=Vibrio sp. SS-MA-C1-2 TaxID=2908646 RepID=UPI001F3F571B|nr:hypothetical protein [Vibrio sp. SS-MA-C1-2]UJF17569.1 hypothetical protein L0B53_02015 [Vibrio sp. SS-MA-C1-2]
MLNNIEQHSPTIQHDSSRVIGSIYSRQYFSETCFVKKVYKLTKILKECSSHFSLDELSNSNKVNAPSTKLELSANEKLSSLFNFNNTLSATKITKNIGISHYLLFQSLKRLSSIALAIKENKETSVLVNQYSDIELLTMKPKKVISLCNELISGGQFNDILMSSFNHKFKAYYQTGKVLVSRAKYQYWVKIFSSHGLPKENIIPISIKTTQDIEHLKRQLITLYENKTPVLAVIPMLSLKDETIDSISALIRLRHFCEAVFKSSFYIHVDGTNSGYNKYYFTDEDNELIHQEYLSDLFDSNTNFDKENDTKNLNYNSRFQSLSGVDSITLEQPKNGAFQQDFGALVIKDNTFNGILYQS